MSDLPAGRELDAAVWLVLNGQSGNTLTCRYVDGDVQPHAGYPVGHISPPAYSTDWAAAGQVAERLGFSIWCAGGGGLGWSWGAGYWRGDGMPGETKDLLCWSYDLPPEDCLSPICKTAPHAISLAALAAMEAAGRW